MVHDLINPTAPTVSIVDDVLHQAVADVTFRLSRFSKGSALKIATSSV